MSNAPIIIILQKSNCTDDILTMTPIQNEYGCVSGFDSTFVQSTIGVVTRHYMEGDHVTDYIHRFVQSLVLDERGCEYIQIDCPAYPTIIKSIDTIQSYIPVLREQILSLLHAWPTIPFPACSIRSKHRRESLLWDSDV